MNLQASEPSHGDKPRPRKERDRLDEPAFLVALLITAFIIIAVVWYWVHLITSTKSAWAGLIVIAGILIGVMTWPFFLYLPFPISEFLNKLFESSRGGPPWYRNPTDPDYFPHGWRTAVDECKKLLNARLDSENAALAKLGILMPTVSKPASFQLFANQHRITNNEYHTDGIQIEFPSFKVPPFHFYSLLAADFANKERACGYLVSGKAAQAFQNAVSVDPALAVKNYKGLWLNRAPYDLHHDLEKLRFSFAKLADLDTWNRNELPRLLNPSDRPTLATTKAPDVKMTEARIDFLRACTAGVGFPDEIGAPLPGWISDAMVFQLPLPEHIECKRVHLKLLPAGKTAPGVHSQFLNALRCLRLGFRFQLAAADGTCSFRLQIAQEDKSFVEDQLRLYVPECATEELTDPFSQPESGTRISSQNYYKPIRKLREFAVDPLAPLLQLLDRLDTKQRFSFEVAAYPVLDEAIALTVNEMERLYDKETLMKLQWYWGWHRYLGPEAKMSKEVERLSHNLRQRVSDLKEKPPAWLVSISLFADDDQLVAKAKPWLDLYGRGDQQLKTAELKTAAANIASDSWSLLNTDELAAFVHLPGADIESQRLERTTGTMKPPPALMSGQGSVLGINEFRGQKTTVVLPEQIRDRHLYIIGKTRTGKSTLMLNLAVQDIRAGKGVGVIDPHGDLIDDLLRYIPKERVQDTIYWDASERERPIALNIMEVHTDEEVGIVADDLVVTFRRLSEAWGERMENLLRYVFHTLLSCDGTTFFDVQHILTSPVRREALIGQLEDPTLIDFWNDQFSKLKDATQPIVARMGKFVLTPVLKNVLGQRESSLNFFDVLQNKKILLINLAQGKVGEDSAKLLGSLIVSQIQLAAMRRAKVRKEAREPFYLYVDEFQNFTTSAFDKILSEAGKYKLCLALAHQYVSQLEDKIRNAILGNAGTILMFPSAAQDASCLRSELGSFTVDDLTDLSAQEHEALCRPPTKSSDTFKLKTFPPPARPQPHFAREVAEYSRANYGRPIQVTPSQPKPAAAEKPQPRPAVPPTMPVPSATSRPAPAAVAHPPSAAHVAAAQPASSTPGAMPAPSIPSPGRGGKQHKYLQELIKRWGESKGYRVTIEKDVLGGAGCVDVALEREELTIACEICVTTPLEKELANIQKCLAAGFGCVALVSTDRKVLNKANGLVNSAVSSNDAERVRFFSPEEFLSFLLELNAEAAGKEERSHGYKVRVGYKAVSQADQQARQQAVVQTIVEAMRRMRSIN